MKNVCIICGTEFQSARSARFCPDKPGCRQAFNRKEHQIKNLADQICENAVALINIAGGSDVNFAAFARSQIERAELTVSGLMDQTWPTRHPKKEITARPVRRAEHALAKGEQVYIMPPVAGDGMKVEIIEERPDGWILCQVPGQNYWDKSRILVPSGSLLVTLYEPETDTRGREVIAKHNPGWGTVVNPGGQTEIAPIEPDGDDDEYNDDDEDWEA